MLFALMLKPLMRVIHFTSLALLSAAIFVSIVIEKPSDNLKMASTIMGIGSGVGLVVSGLVNWYLLKSFKPNSHPRAFKIWTGVIHTKLLLTLIVFSPLPKLLFSNQLTGIFRAVFIGLFILGSPFIRATRELNSQKKR